STMKTKINWIANILATDRCQRPDAMVSYEAALKGRFVQHNVTWQLMMVLAGLAVSWPASADDQFPPCWRNQPGSTFQEWRFDTSANPATPESANNPNGTPQATATVGAFGSGWIAVFPP